MTDRAGEVVQKYTYTPFGRELHQDNTQAFEVSHRFTGQIFDEDTGLYYFNARYYDPELGRFTSADTIVQDPQNPQTLNRYAYCGNNPLKYTDPSGHEFITAIVIGVLIGAAIGAATAAATGQNIFLGALTGAISGAFGGIGGAVGAAYGATWGAVAAIGGGAAAGSINSAITGQNIAMGALTGAVAAAVSFGTTQFTASYISTNEYALGGAAVVGGAVGGGTTAEISGGNFAEGAMWGAAGAAGGFLAGSGIRAISKTIAASLTGGQELIDVSIDGTLEEWANAVFENNKEAAGKFMSRVNAAWEITEAMDRQILTPEQKLEFGFRVHFGGSKYGKYSFQKLQSGPARGWNIPKFFSGRSGFIVVHTHPGENVPRLSPTDLRGISQYGSSGGFKEYSFFVVVGRKAAAITPTYDVRQNLKYYSR